MQNIATAGCLYGRIIAYCYSPSVRVRWSSTGEEKEAEEDGIRRKEKRVFYVREKACEEQRAFGRLTRLGMREACHHDDGAARLVRPCGAALDACLGSRQRLMKLALRLATRRSGSWLNFKNARRGSRKCRTEVEQGRQSDLGGVYGPWWPWHNSWSSWSVSAWRKENELRSTADGVRR